MRALLGLLAAVALVGACTEHDPEIDRVGAPLPEAGSCSFPLDSKAQFPCEIDAILAARCRRCHQDPMQNGAPFPLLTWNDTQGDYGGPIYQRMHKMVTIDYMPYCAEGTSCAGIVKDGKGPVLPLSAEQKTTLLAWLECPTPAFGITCDAGATP